MFHRNDIKQAKVGTHSICFVPGQAPVEARVSKVRGEFVWVKVGKGEIKLNRMCSQILMEGKYRK